jgi:hypothetical protein
MLFKSDALNSSLTYFYISSQSGNNKKTNVVIVYKAVPHNVSMIPIVLSKSL